MKSLHPDAKDAVDVIIRCISFALLDLVLDCTTIEVLAPAQLQTFCRVHVTLV